MTFLDGVREVAEHGGECVGVCDRGISFVDVIETVVLAFGVCSMVVCSGAVHESSVRRLVALEQAGAVKEFWLFLSCELLKMNPLSFQGARRAAGERLRLARTHAKFVVLVGEERCLVVLTTANLNANRRHESYTITSSAELAFDLIWHCCELDRVGAVPGERSAYYLDTFARVLSNGRPVERDLSLTELIRRM